MDTLKRAFKYVIRKRGKTLILFMLFLTIGILVLSGISIKRAGDISQDSLRKTMGGELTIDVNYSDENPYYKEEKFEDGRIIYSSKQMTVDMVEKVMKISGMRSCEASVDTLCQIDDIDFFSGNIPIEEEFKNMTTVVGTYSTETNDYFQSGKVKLIEGKNINSDNGNPEIIISKDLAELNHLKVGDQLAVTNTKGNKIEITIVGIFQQKEVESIEEKVTSYEKIQNKIFTNIQTIMAIEESPYITGFTTIHAQIEDPAKMNQIVEEIKKIDEFEWDKKAFSININNETFERAEMSLKKVENFINIFLLVVVIVSIIILSLILNMWGRSRIHETGVYLALGLEKVQIIGQYILEVLIVAMFAFIVAYFPGRVVSDQLSDYLMKHPETEQGVAMRESSTEIGIEEGEIHVEISIEEIVMVYIIGVAIIIIATTISTFSIMHLKPRELLTKMS